MLIKVNNVLADGDCGSCTVALGRLEEGILTYRAVNSCLMPAVRVHGRHLITVEGLARGGELHLIQRRALSFWMEQINGRNIDRLYILEEANRERLPAVILDDFNSSSDR